MATNLSHSDFHGPSWDNRAEYSDFNDSHLTQDIASIERLIGEIDNLAAPLAKALESPYLEEEACLIAATRMIPCRDEVLTLVSNINTYCNCVLSVDGTHAEAKRLLNQTEATRAKIAVALQPLNLWLTLTSNRMVERFLHHPKASKESFPIARLRINHDHVLPLPEENLLRTMEVHGPNAFGRLYEDISTSLKCQVLQDGAPATVGLAQAANLLSSSDEATRKAAYYGVNQAWESQQESCAAVLNHLNGWRHEVMKQRSYKKEMHYLDPALHRGCIERRTLDAMMSAASQRKELGQRALKIQAKVLGKERLGPWDLFAPCPPTSSNSCQRWTFAEALTLIKTAFNSVDPMMGEFVDIMTKNNWIEGTAEGNKRPGAYCTKFLKSRSPRVYMTYTGSMDNVTTLAHELGHAFHNWVMRDLALSETSYPMTLAETASILAETVVSNYLFEQASANGQKLLPLLWNSGADAAVYLLNIPARFTFEKEFNERRLTATVNPQEMKQLMCDAWQQWYGDSLSEMNAMFWASKLHFHISSLSFYNFPYTFGYLFSLGVYGQRKVLKEKFFPTYVNLLRDAGRMTAEDLAYKYLQVDIGKIDFWLTSLDEVEQKVNMFAAATLKEEAKS